MSNIPLKELQNNMMNYLLNDDNRICADIVRQGKVSNKTRLNIYKNAYSARLKEVIDNDHQILGFYLGDELFEQMVSGYIQNHPSSYRSLRHFADQLPNFLATQLPFKQHPILSELAHFERLLLVAFDAADATRMTFDTLHSIAPQDWPELMFKFHPSVQIAHFSWNSIESWQALKQEHSPKAATPQQSTWLLWRNNERLTEFRSLSEEEFTLMSMILSGKNFSMMCDQLLTYSSNNDASELALHYLSTWVEQGLLREPVTLK
ncbi:DNA-binding domain-containing protein [Thalassotalea fonticola]|uniref:DNA-binding domain-containing protein n=1 Tax=Thalassotalea fonticola TaxID=3065649 RepID=A0ABZ0GUI6_9GAMM|nr:DNA-binding domain-containing protein [Colwelliaceae bacterium S1-1]